MAIFRLEYEKTVAMLDFTTFNLSKCNISCNKNFFKFRIKFVLFGCFWTGIRKTYFTVIILHQHLQIFSNTKFHSKIKILRLGTKIALNDYFGLEFQKTNVIIEISILEFVNMQRFIRKQRNFKLGTKNTLFRYFLAAI